MLSGCFNQFSSRGLVVVLLQVVTASCGPRLVPTILEGQQFAHQIHFPAAFQRPRVGNELLLLDQYTFRISPSSPNTLLVAACTYTVLSQYKFRESTRVCSPNAFVIETEHSYAVHEAKPGEWEQALPAGEKEMNDPVRRTLKEELAKPAYLSPIPIKPSPGHGFYPEGYTYRGREFRRRGDWIWSLNFIGSDDGRLVVLAGVDKRKLPEHGFLGDAINAGFSGLVTLDIFDTEPSRRIAALDVESHQNVNAARGQMSLVNSRWVAIGLDMYLQDMLLFDFPQPRGEAK